MSLDFYRTQTPVTDPGAAGDWLADLPDDIPGLSRVARELVLHYRAADMVELGIPAARLPEIHSRYSDVMLTRLRAAAPGSIADSRAPQHRTIGCCRDFAVLMVTMARHQGIPARLRVGFMTYAIPDALLDHAVAEVWDEARGEWRLVDPQLRDDARDPHDDAPVDRTNVPRDRFLTGGDAWQACRRGNADPGQFMVDPSLRQPELRGWPYLAHNLVLDLAALNADELLLWDSWEFIERDPTAPEQRALLDTIAASTAGPAPDHAELSALFATLPGVRPPYTIIRFDPYGGQPQLEVRRASCLALARAI